MWWSGVEAMARLHRVEPMALELDLGPTDDPVGYRLEFWEQFVRWATPDKLPLLDESLSWLHHNRPHPTAPLSVTWGDAKLGNIIFSEGRWAAILDWELCGIGYAEEDLAHWIWMDHFASAAHGLTRLEGLPSRNETVARYQHWLGRKVEALDWWRFYSGFRLSVICHRIMHQVRSLGGLPPDTDVGTVNPVTGLLGELLQEMG
jgi:aminoglycoside phosphotransferase (APT) family kinase protein